MRKTGTLKWFNTAKGFGFIAPDTGSKDDFVHISAFENSGIKDIKEGDRVAYEMQENRGRMCAVNITEII